MVSSLFTLRCCVLCKQREDWTWLCAMCSEQSTESKHGENHLSDWHPCSIPCTSVIRISGLSCSSSWHSSYRILWRTGSAQALETLGALSEGERLPPSSKYRAKPGNLPVHAERAPIVSGEGRWAHSGPGRESMAWYRLERWEQHTQGLARGSMVQEGGERKAAEVNSSLILPGAKDFSHRQPVLVVPPPLTGLGWSSSPLVSDLFVAQKGFDLWKFLSFPGLVCWICIAKCSIQNCHPMPTSSHFSNTF